MRGTDPPRCKNHAGKSRGELAEQRARHDEIAKAQLKVQRMVARAGVDLDPAEHLLDTLHIATQQGLVFGEMVADLDNAGEVNAAEVIGRIRGTRYDALLATNQAGTLTVHPFVTLWIDAVERRAKLAKLAIDADVAERLVTLQEDTAAHLDDLIGRALIAAGVDHAAQLAVRHALAAELDATVVDVEAIDLDD